MELNMGNNETTVAPSSNGEAEILFFLRGRFTTSVHPDRQLFPLCPLSFILSRFWLVFRILPPPALVVAWLATRKFPSVAKTGKFRPCSPRCPLTWEYSKGTEHRDAGQAVFLRLYRQKVSNRVPPPFVPPRRCARYLGLAVCLVSNIDPPESYFPVPNRPPHQTQPSKVDSVHLRVLPGGSDRSLSLLGNHPPNIHPTMSKIKAPSDPSIVLHVLDSVCPFHSTFSTPKSCPAAVPSHIMPSNICTQPLSPGLKPGNALGVSAVDPNCHDCGTVKSPLTSLGRTESCWWPEVDDGGKPISSVGTKE